MKFVPMEVMCEMNSLHPVLCACVSFFCLLSVVSIILSVSLSGESLVKFLTLHTSIQVYFGRKYN